jgi:hypothetical protein
MVTMSVETFKTDVIVFITCYVYIITLMHYLFKDKIFVVKDNDKMASSVKICCQNRKVVYKFFFIFYIEF